MFPAAAMRIATSALGSCAASTPAAGSGRRDTRTERSSGAGAPLTDTLTQVPISAGTYGLTCGSIHAVAGSVEPSAEVAMRMAAAGNIFRPYGPGGSTGRDPTSAPEGGCFALPLDEARMLADALLPPSGDGVHERWGIVHSFGAQPDPARPGATRDESAYIYFDRLMPDGVPFGSFGD